MENFQIDPRTHVFYLLHYPVVRFRALLIRNLAENTYIFSDKDFPGRFEELTTTEVRWYLSQHPELLDLSNPHHKDMVESFGLLLENA